MAMGTKAKERLGKECYTEERSTKEDTLAKEKASQQEKEKGVPTQGCYRCGPPGHIARDRRVAVHNLNEAAANTNTYAGH